MLIIFFITASLALVGILYPLRRERLLLVGCLSSSLLLSFYLSYHHWGAWTQWQHYRGEASRQQEAKKLLTQVGSPEKLVEKLRAKLDKTPQSAHGWYLLGRVYSSQNKWTRARDAFLLAHELNPEDELATVNYAYSLWQLNQQKFNLSIRELFTELLQKNPQQPDALAMLAMDAYHQQKYTQAEAYWQKLLQLVTPGSEEAKALQKAIVKAQQQIKPLSIKE